MAKNDEILYDLLKEVREEQKEIKDDLTEHKILFKEHIVQDSRMYNELNEMRNCLNDISLTLRENTESLQQHMRRTTTLEEMWEDHKKRLETLEEPAKVKSFLHKKFAIYSSVVAGVIGIAAALAKLL